MTDSDVISAEGATDTPCIPPGKNASRRWHAWAIVTTAAVAIAIFAANEVLVGRPVSGALSSDVRNGGFRLRAHFRYFVDPSTVVLDLRNVKAAAPVDLFRGVFQTAEALRNNEPRFARVVLSRDGTPVFLMSGDDFRALGASFAVGENPVYLIRTWPEKLYYPNGTRAFASWEGGLFGVLSRQMDDATSAARQWAEGSVPTPP